MSIHDLPDAEDLSNDDSYRLVGLFLRVWMQLNQLSAGITKQATLAGHESTVTPSLIQQEEYMEKWLDSAQDYLPEWFDLGLLDDSAPLNRI